MRRELGFGSLDLPGGWQDQSTYHFAGEVQGAPRVGLLAKGTAERRPIITVTLTAGRAPKELAIEQVLGEQEKELAAAFRGFRRLPGPPWTHPEHGTVPQIEFSFDAAPGVTVRQRQSYFRWPAGERFSCLAIACEALAYDTARPEMEAVFASFRLPGS